MLFLLLIVPSLSFFFFLYFPSLSISFHRFLFLPSPSLSIPPSKTYPISMDNERWWLSSRHHPRHHRRRRRCLYSSTNSHFIDWKCLVRGGLLYTEKNPFVKNEWTGNNHEINTLNECGYSIDRKDHNKWKKSVFLSSRYIRYRYVESKRAHL